jgi:hypothetical protein
MVLSYSSASGLILGLGRIPGFSFAPFIPLHGSARRANRMDEKRPELKMPEGDHSMV